MENSAVQAGLDGRLVQPFADDDEHILPLRDGGQRFSGGGGVQFQPAGLPARVRRKALHPQHMAAGPVRKQAVCRSLQLLQRQVLFQKTEYTDGLINLMLHWFGAGPVDFISGPYWAKMFVLCFYTIWVVMPFKILILTSALASVNPDYYKAAKVDGTSKTRIFWKITVPMISPMIFYLIITGFIGAFKAYSDAVALFGTDLNAAGMNTIVGYVYDMLYGDSGGFPSYASAAAILLFVIVLTITCINLLVSKKHVHY